MRDPGEDTTTILVRIAIIVHNISNPSVLMAAEAEVEDPADPGRVPDERGRNSHTRVAPGYQTFQIPTDLGKTRQNALILHSAFICLYWDSQRMLHKQSTSLKVMSNLNSNKWLRVGLNDL